MKTAILCGGFGTRIRDVAEDLPKPMIPVGGLPILWHIMKYYASWDFQNFVLALGYQQPGHQAVLPELRGLHQRLHHHAGQRRSAPLSQLTPRDRAGR